MYLDIKELSVYLKIKPSTLYAWVARHKIPSIRTHGLIRFEKEAIDVWLESFKRREQKKAPSIYPPVKDQLTIDEFIEKAKREVYNSDRGETRPRSPKKRRKMMGLYKRKQGLVDGVELSRTKDQTINRRFRQEAC